MGYATKNCIICGKKLKGTEKEPAAYSGTVLIDDLIVVMAGVCYNQKCNVKRDKKTSSCFGRWKRWHGIVERE